MTENKLVQNKTIWDKLDEILEENAGEKTSTRGYVRYQRRRTIRKKRNFLNSYYGKEISSLVEPIDGKLAKPNFNFVGCSCDWCYGKTNRQGWKYTDRQKRLRWEDYKKELKTEFHNEYQYYDYDDEFSMDIQEYFDDYEYPMYQEYLKVKAKYDFSPLTSKLEFK